MVPPVLRTRTRASVTADGEVAGSTDSVDLQLSNFLLLHVCSGGQASVPSSSFGCDRARARGVRLSKLESAIVTCQVSPALPL